MPKLVTRLTFVPTAERLPTEPGNYLCLARYGDVFTLQFNTKHNMFNVSDDDTSTAIVPLAWAKTPASITPFVKELTEDDE